MDFLPETLLAGILPELQGLILEHYTHLLVDAPVTQEEAEWLFNNLDVIECLAVDLDKGTSSRTTILVDKASKSGTVGETN
jgi:hypothetical protein